MATVDAKFTAANSVEVTTARVGAFTLNLMGHPQFDADRKVAVKVDGQSFSVRSADAVSFTRSNGKWENRKFTPGLTSKQPGAEGPLWELLQARTSMYTAREATPPRKSWPPGGHRQQQQQTGQAWEAA